MGECEYEEVVFDYSVISIKPLEELSEEEAAFIERKQNELMMRRLPKSVAPPLIDFYGRG